MISETKLDLSFPNGRFQKFMATLNLIDLIGMELVVEYLFLSVRTYPRNL